MIAPTQQRWIAVAVAAMLLVGGLLLARLHVATPERSNATPLSQTADAYRALGAALEQAGLLPFAPDIAGLQAGPLLTGPHALPLTRSTDSTGQPVFLCGTVLTVMTGGGHPTRYLLRTQTGQELSGSPLGAALQQLSQLPLSSQRTVQLGNSGGLPMESQAFYFDYSSHGRSWRFMPQFEGQNCVRVDVVQL